VLNKLYIDSLGTAITPLTYIKFHFLTFSERVEIYPVVRSLKCCVMKENVLFSFSTNEAKPFAGKRFNFTPNYKTPPLRQNQQLYISRAKWVNCSKHIGSIW
jgi:hypothetical protein